MTAQAHLDRIQTINQGSFYTPDSIVCLVYQMLLNAKIDIKDYVLLDSSCGYGSFLNLEGFKQNIGADIDKQALQEAQKIFKDYAIAPLFLHTNSLQNVSREKFNILESSKLIIVGNPPYNDKTSIVQNCLKNIDSTPVDSQLKARDIGISFLRSFDILKADYICVLHPLSYLIKESNFKSLKNFIKHYHLLDSTIISSQIFCPKSLGFFPIVIALYERDNQGMDFDFICNFSFKTREGKSFRLNDFDFVAKYIDKYPNKKRVDSRHKVAMFYTLRDINALRRSKTFISKNTANAVYVTQDKYSLYCYVDVFKQIIKHIPYYLGNCDILIDFKKFQALESAFIKASENKILSEDIMQYFKDLLGEHYMRIESVRDNKIRVEIPLTTQSGKIRVKIRNSFYEYGIPTATKQIPFSQKHYIEWQIGYDVDKSDKEKLALSTLQETHFVGANEKNKALYELSEYLYYFVQWGIINKTEIENLCTFLQNLKNEDFIDSREDLQIFRSHPKQKQILDIEFYVSEVKYPLLVHKFGNFDVLVEIIIKEKQRAIGVQPMLYVCFPITELEPKNKTTFLGKAANTKECGILSLDARHKTFVLECFKIFGILSKNHHYDVLQILHLIKKIFFK